MLWFGFGFGSFDVSLVFIYMYAFRTRFLPAKTEIFFYVWMYNIFFFWWLLCVQLLFLASGFSFLFFLLLLLSLPRRFFSCLTVLIFIVQCNMALAREQHFYIAVIFSPFILVITVFFSVNLVNGERISKHLQIPCMFSIPYLYHTRPSNPLLRRAHSTLEHIIDIDTYMNGQAQCECNFCKKMTEVVDGFFFLF